MRFTAFPPIPRRCGAVLAACIVTGLAFAAHAQAEGRVRIVDQFGIGSLLHKVGVIRNEPKSWRDYFFDDPPASTGS